MSASALAYRPDIDGLRAIAVSSVVLCHAGLGLPGGYVGVDVFFVISGYLITSLILKELDQRAFSLARFWERRVRRILPALAAVTAIAAVAGWWLLLPDASAALGKSIIGLALLASNFHFWLETGYFEAQSVEKPLLHTWSLAVEEQFYLFIPLFLFLLGRRDRLRVGFWILAAIAVASFGLSVHAVHGGFSSAFYLMPARAWELLAGALLARASASVEFRWHQAREVAAALGLACILVPCFLYDNKTPFPGLAALPPVAGAALLIASGGTHRGMPRISRALASRPIVFVGLISYSLYLWHWPLFAFAKYLRVSELTVGDRTLLVAASLVLGILSWRFVERPFRSRRLLASRPQLLTATGLAFLLLMGCGAALGSHRLPQLRSTNGLAELFTTTGKKDLRYFNELSVDDVPTHLARFGNTDVPPEILIWGDSHAMAILPAIDSACRDAGISAVAATHSSTPPVIGYEFRSFIGQNGHSVRFNAAVMHYVRSRAVRAVVLVGYWQAYEKEEGPALADALLKTVDKLNDAGVVVYFMKDVPVFDVDVPKTLALQSSRGLHVPMLSLSPSDYDAKNSFQSRLLPALIERHARIIDPIPILQARSRSADIVPFDAEGSYYVDTQHLSTHGALALKPMFTPMINAVTSESRTNPRSVIAGR